MLVPHRAYLRRPGWPRLIKLDDAIGLSRTHGVEGGLRLERQQRNVSRSNSVPWIYI